MYNISQKTTHLNKVPDVPGLVGEARDANATGVVTLVAAVEEEGGLQCTSNNHSIPSSQPAVLTQPCF